MIPVANILAIFWFEAGHDTTIRMFIQPIHIPFMDVAEITSSSSGLMHNEIYTAENETEPPTGKIEIKDSGTHWPALKVSERSLLETDKRIIPIKDFKCLIPVQGPAIESDTFEFCETSEC